MKIIRHILAVALFAILVTSVSQAEQPPRSPLTQSMLEAGVKSSGIDFRSMSSKGNHGLQLQLQEGLNLEIEIIENLGLLFTAKFFNERGATLEFFNNYNKNSKRTFALFSCAYLDEADVPTNQYFLLTEPEVTPAFVASAVNRFVGDTHGMAGALHVAQVMKRMKAPGPAGKKK